MKKIIFPVFLIFVLIFGFLLVKANEISHYYGAPPYISDDSPISQYLNKYSDLTEWVRPSGPIRVGLQAGHWKIAELPDELKRLRESGGGTSNGHITEWEVNLSIARKTKEILESDGIVVDILPATIPPGYYADAVVAIHADGNINPATSGFKVASPRRDRSGKADQLAKTLEEVYKEKTKLQIDPNITRNMTGYYAFNWRRFDHSTHPMAPAVILETGFLTNPYEADILINNPDLPAGALAEGILNFLNETTAL